MAEKNYNAFEGLNTSNARMENETREQYKARLKAIKKVEKLYFKLGREAFQQMFPNGVGEALKNSAEEAYNENNPPTEYNEKEAKDFIKKMQKSAEELPTEIPTEGFGEAK